MCPYRPMLWDIYVPSGMYIANKSNMYFANRSSILDSVSFHNVVFI